MLPTFDPIVYFPFWLGIVVLLISGALWLRFRTHDLLLAFHHWVSKLVVFVFLGLPGLSAPQPIVWSSVFGLASHHLFAKAVSRRVRLSALPGLHFSVGFFGVLTSLLLLEYQFDSTLALFPAVAAAALPLVRMGYVAFRFHRRELGILGTLLALNALTLAVAWLVRGFAVNHPELTPYLQILPIALSFSLILFLLSWQMEDLGDSSTRRDIELQTAKVLSGMARLTQVGQMTAGILHEINQPLQVISGRISLLSSELLKPSPSLEVLRKYVQALERNSLRLAQIINSFRSTYREGANDPISEISLATTIEQTVHALVPMAKKTRVKVIGPHLEKDCIVLGRAVQIGQVLLNLMVNAIDAVENLAERWIRIEVNPMPEEIGGGSVEVSVIDSGSGIPEEHRKHLFRALYTTKTGGKGTGLGLPICQTILEEHHGSIWLNENHPNTCFTFRLPLSALRPLKNNVKLPHPTNPSSNTA